MIDVTTRRKKSTGTHETKKSQVRIKDGFLEDEQLPLKGRMRRNYAVGWEEEPSRELAQYMRTKAGA